MKIEDKLYLIGFKVDEIGGSHLIVDQSKCTSCADRQCLFICPAGVYEFDEASEKVIVNYDACVECGTCRIACDYIDWRYPRGGFGVSYKFG